MLKETDIFFQEPVLSLDYVLNPIMGPRTQTPEVGWEIQIVENDFIKVFQLPTPMNESMRTYFTCSVCWDPSTRRQPETGVPVDGSTVYPSRTRPSRNNISLLVGRDPSPSLTGTGRSLIITQHYLSHHPVKQSAAISFYHRNCLARNLTSQHCFLW
jgi:hypothetical protein